MNIPLPSRKFAIIFDDADKTTINKNIGLFAQLLADHGISVEIITSHLKKNSSIIFGDKKISIIRLKTKDKWPQLNHKIFFKYIEENINQYFCIWVYRGRPYTKRIIELARRNKIETLLKLDSDSEISFLTKSFFTLCKKIKLDPAITYSRVDKLIGVFSFLPVIKGFYMYDSPLFRSSYVLSESKESIKVLKMEISSISIFFLPNSIPIKKYKQLERKNIYIKKKNLIISVGRIVRSKAFERAIEAYSLLPKGLQTIWKLEIIGPILDESYHKFLKKLIYKYRLNNNVQITSGLYGKDLFKKYTESSVLLMPYPKDENGKGAEGQPNVVIEAMFFKNAIIATDIPGVKVLVNKKNSILIPSNNTQTILKNLQKILVDKKLREAMQENSRKRVVSNFNLDKIGEDLVKKILTKDYQTYISDQQEDSLAMVPEVIEKAVYRYLDFFVKENTSLNFKKIKILDIGCREFFSYDYFKKKYNLTISGIEIGPDALEFGKRKNITEVDIHFMDTVIKRNSYDVLLSFHVFEHMYDLPLALGKCRNILKKGGLLFFAIPMPAYDTRRSHWVNIPNKKHMLKLVEDAGFKIIFEKTYKANIFRNEPEMLCIAKRMH